MDFYRYPAIGVEDWRYGFSTAKVRVLESMLLTRATLADMASAANFESTLELLGGSEYASASTAENFAAIEAMLLERRAAARAEFAELMLDEEIVDLLRAREDFANMRLAIRRVVTGKPIGLDYSNEGSVPAEEFEEIFEQENYSRFPDYLQDGVEEAVLGYYESKDIRTIDYAIDRVMAAYKIKRAEELQSVFLESLYRTRVDITNIRTMLRLKMAERDERNLFLEGGFIETSRFVHGLDAGYEALAGLFYATCYNDIVEGGVNYLTSKQSFLGLEKLCEEHVMGFLKTTQSLASGPQPVIAYFLRKENEIRTLRMVLSCKKNGLDTRLILDRLSEI
jgi:V/A-type H+-transporting ATPase subunit C